MIALLRSRLAPAVAALLAALSLHSCIEPPLKLASESVLVDLPIVNADLKVVWNIDFDLQTEWYYGWDETDRKMWGDIGYTLPTNYEVRRYYLGTEPGGPHTREGLDAFTIFGNRFRRTYYFGYYDLLVWSNIDSKDGTQVLKVDDSNLDYVKATTSVTRGLSRDPENPDQVTALYNQPEVFFSTYPRDIHISERFEDYDYFDEEEQTYVKNITATMKPLVYIYLVQIVLHNNDGRIIGTTGDCAVSAFASATNVNTGRTGSVPCMVYFGTRMKRGIELKGETVEVIGGRLTTFGLCDMEGWEEGSKAEYSGSRQDLPNYIYYTLKFDNASQKTFVATITDQCQSQSHGGIITLHVDCSKVEVPPPGDVSSTGGMFYPTIEDYENVDYDIPM